MRKMSLCAATLLCAAMCILKMCPPVYAATVAYNDVPFSTYISCDQQVDESQLEECQPRHIPIEQVQATISNQQEKITLKLVPIGTSKEQLNSYLKQKIQTCGVIKK